MSGRAGELSAPHTKLCSMDAGGTTLALPGRHHPQTQGSQAARRDDRLVGACARAQGWVPGGGARDRGWQAELWGAGLHLAAHVRHRGRGGGGAPSLEVLPPAGGHVRHHGCWLCFHDPVPCCARSFPFPFISDRLYPQVSPQAPRPSRSEAHPAHPPCCWRLGQQGTAPSASLAHAYGPGTQPVGCRSCCLSGAARMASPAGALDLPLAWRQGHDLHHDPGRCSPPRWAWGTVGAPHSHSFH